MVPLTDIGLQCVEHPYLCASDPGGEPGGRSDAQRLAVLDMEIGCVPDHPVSHETLCHRRIHNRGYHTTVRDTVVPHVLLAKLEYRNEMPVVSERESNPCGYLPAVEYALRMMPAP